jgi:hypothetical protein
MRSIGVKNAFATPALQPVGCAYAALLVAACKDLDSVWVWFYKDVAPTALEMFQ